MDKSCSHAIASKSLDMIFCFFSKFRVIRKQKYFFQFYSKAFIFIHVLYTYIEKFYDYSNKDDDLPRFYVQSKSRYYHNLYTLQVNFRH